MKIIKNIFIGLGVIFLLFIGLAIFLAGAQSEFKEDNQQFVIDFTRDFSQSWEIARVSDHLTNDMLAQANTPNGVHALNVFKSFGKLVEIKDLEIGNYSTHSSGVTSAVFTFKAEFQNANGLVTVTVQEQNDRVYIHGFNIEQIGELSAPKEIKT